MHDGPDTQGTVLIPAGIFNAFRTVPFPPYYGEAKTPVTVDVLEAGLFTAIAILAVCFLLVLPGIPGSREKVFGALRIFFSLFVVSAIVLCNFGQEWEYSKIHTATAYKAGTGKEIHATIEVKIGLRSVNITLRGTPETQLGEKINYNERFSWTWAQGRFGFGPNSGRFNREFRQAQFEGKPLPILWIAEYFTFDGEGIRFGRFYRTAGWYTHIALWAAFPAWILTNILFFMLVRYAAYMMCLTGSLMLIANILFSNIRNFNPLKIPFEEGVLEPTWGWCWWLCLITGAVTVILGLIILVLDHFFAFETAKFFGVDPLQDFEETFVETNSEAPRGTHSRMKEGDMELMRRDGRLTSKDPARSGASNGARLEAADDSDEELYQNMETRMPIYKKRGLSRIQKKTFKNRAPYPAPRTQNIPEEEETEDYVNSAFAREAAQPPDVQVRVQ